MNAATVLTREMLRDGHLRRLIAAGGDVRPLSDEELAHSLGSIMARRAGTGGVWLFAYGSLIWNPTFDHVETRLARVIGWHRRFCLWTRLGRGTPQRPGLMLGLERGGSCGGVAYRIDDAVVQKELELVWRREMVTGAYRPTWVRCRTGQGLVEAIAFVIERRHERYAGKLPDADVAATLAEAHGPLGTCRDYLVQTASNLTRLGIGDTHLDRLCELVQAAAPTPARPASGAQALAAS